MARIFGEIESLTRLKDELNNRNITRFNSVKEINSFLTNFNNEINEVYEHSEKYLEKRYFKSLTERKDKKQKKESLIKEETERLAKREKNLSDLIKTIKNNKKSNFLIVFIDKIKLFINRRKLNHIKKNKSSIILSSVSKITSQIENSESFIKEYETNKSILIERKSKSQINELKHIKSNIEDLQNLIAGAIGENQVVKEIQKLSDEFVLINDYQIRFDSPIFYKKNNERIYSAQIDHLLISRTGVFILETKNWSKSSINSLNLRSPIEQIHRSSFALFIHLSNHIKLNHHWGIKKIPIRNILVMINNKPSTDFEFIKVKKVNELNYYVNNFKAIFSKLEFEKIVEELTY